VEITLFHKGQERKINVAEGQTIAAAALEAGVSLYGSCGGRGLCCGCSRYFRSGIDRLFNTHLQRKHEHPGEGYASYAKTCVTTPLQEGVIVEADRTARLS